MSSIITRKFKGLREGVSSYGVEHVLRVISWRLPSWIFQYDHTFVLGVKSIGIEPLQAGDFSFRLATPDDAERLKTVGISPELTLKRMNAGDKCAIAVRDEEIVSMYWATIGRLYIKTAGSILETGADGFYPYNAYTVPSERRKGLFKGCCHVLFSYYYSVGRKQMLNAVSAFNLVSLVVQEKTGRRVVGETYMVNLMGIHFCFYKSWPYPTRKAHFYFRRPDTKTRAI